MKLSAIPVVLASLALSCLVVAGCAADTTEPPAAEDAEDTNVSQDELNSKAAAFVGAYSWRAGDSLEFVDFQQLTLKGDGTYTAKVDSGLVNPAVRCVAFPCTLPEAGAWSAVSSGGKLKIRVNPAGSKPARSYFASVNALSRTLTLTRLGHTTNLFTDGSSCANVRCTATTHCEMKGINGGSIPVCIDNAPPPPPQPACVKSGCSGQVCADRSFNTTCEMRREYACYHAASCERQADGACGWTTTPALTTCIANAQQ
jgi:outer membrane murein-binding lipoprotein Lpp